MLTRLPLRQRAYQNYDSFVCLPVSSEALTYPEVHNKQNVGATGCRCTGFHLYCVAVAGTDHSGCRSQAQAQAQAEIDPQETDMEAHEPQDCQQWVMAVAARR
jgi:hypothetical protein